MEHQPQLWRGMLPFFSTSIIARLTDFQAEVSYNSKASTSFLYTSQLPTPYSITPVLAATNQTAKY